MANDESQSASRSDLGATRRDLERQIEVLKQSIPGLVEAGVAKVCAKIVFQGDAIISISGQFPNWTLRATLPPFTAQGSGECVDGQIVLSITGGFS